MSATDGQPNFTSNDATRTRKEFSPETNRKLVNDMIKFLSQDDTLDKMREDMNRLLVEDKWGERVEEEMQKVLENSDLATTPYTEMLKGLADSDQLMRKFESEEASANLAPGEDEIEAIINELLKTKNFEIKEELKKRLFKNIDFGYRDILKKAYNKSID